ncbi:hypothetical protein Chor_000510 [Crotalus horridus]
MDVALMHRCLTSPASVTYARKMIPPEERKECGYQGITRKRCKRIGCCFDLKASGAPTCFHPPVNDASQHCVMEGSARLECGYPSITAEECQAKGCCFNSYDINTRWCFHPLSDTVPARLCGMAPKRRVSCGAPGISADECMVKGCCYEHYQYAKTQNANVTLIPTNDPTVDLPGSLPRNAKIKDVASIQQCQESLGALNQQNLKKNDLPYMVTWDNYEFCLLTAKCRCNIDPHKRSNCGPPGITSQECENKGCCFNSTVPGVPWCFKPTPPKYRKVCPTDVKLRKNCGYPGIPADKCAKRKCCFDSNPPGVPWCFFHIIVEEGKEQVCNNPLKETHAKILSGIQYSIDFHCE